MVLPLLLIFLLAIGGHVEDYLHLNQYERLHSFNLLIKLPQMRKDHNSLEQNPPAAAEKSSHWRPDLPEP